MYKVLLLTVSLAAALAVGIVKKYYTDKNPDSISAGFVFNAVGSFLAAIVLLCWGGFGSTSLATCLLAVAFGTVTAVAGVANIAALQCGPMSYTTVIISFSTVISALSGVVLFSESLELVQVAGILMMLVSFVFATEHRDSDEKKMGLKWMALCLLALVTTGSIGVMQKFHQSSEHKGELNSFLIVAFAISALFCTVFALILRKKESKNQATVKNKRLFWVMIVIMLVNGVCTAFNHKINLYLSGIMESAVFFPIVNGGGLLLATLAAVVLFRERLSKKQWIGVAFGIIAVVLLCNPFA